MAWSVETARTSIARKIQVKRIRNFWPPSSKTPPGIPHLQLLSSKTPPGIPHLQPCSWSPCSRNFSPEIPAPATLLLESLSRNPHPGIPLVQLASESLLQPFSRKPASCKPPSGINLLQPSNWDPSPATALLESVSWNHASCKPPPGIPLLQPSSCNPPPGIPPHATLLLEFLLL